MKHILLLTTGGTIASTPTAEGLAPGMDGQDLARRLPFLTDRYTVTVRDILHLDSSNIQPEEWQVIARHVFESKADYDGIIITHGTDTMAYTASVLSFMLQDIRIPVVLTGAPHRRAGEPAAGLCHGGHRPGGGLSGLRPTGAAGLSGGQDPDQGLQRL